MAEATRRTGAVPLLMLVFVPTLSRGRSLRGRSCCPLDVIDEPDQGDDQYDQRHQFLNHFSLQGPARQGRQPTVRFLSIPMLPVTRHRVNGCPAVKR